MVNRLPHSIRAHEEELSEIYHRFGHIKTKKEINRWLNNFRPKHQKYALKLLHEFMYVDQKAVTNFCQKLYSYIKFYDINNPCFVGFGPASKSGPFISYYFRTANKLSEDDFLDFSQIPKSISNKFDSIILLDDFLGSGNQAIDFWTSTIDKMDVNGNIDLNIYFALIGFDKGKHNVERNTKLKVELGMELTEMDKAFFPRNVFQDYYEKEEAKDVIRRYGKTLFPKHPLGYRNSQALIGFFYNTPDNTLPIFWSVKNNWYPLFKRHEISNIHFGTTRKDFKNLDGENAIKKEYNNIFMAHKRYINKYEAIYDWEMPASRQIFDTLNRKGEVAKITLGNQTIFMLNELAIIYSLLINKYNIEEIEGQTNLTDNVIRKTSEQPNNYFRWDKGRLILHTFSPKVVVFDWSDTLVDEYDLDEAICEYIPYNEFEQDRANYLEKTIKFREILADLEKERNHLWYDYIYLANMFEKSGTDIKKIHLINKNKIKPLCGFPALTYELHDRGCQVAIATNCTEPILNWRSEMLKWDLSETVDHIITSDKTKNVLNKEEYIKEIHRLSGARMDEILVVGDHYTKDIVPAKVLGCRTLRILVEHNKSRSYWGTPGMGPDPGLTEIAMCRVSDRVTDYCAPSATSVLDLIK